MQTADCRDDNRPRYRLYIRRPASDTRPLKDSDIRVSTILYTLSWLCYIERCNERVIRYGKSAHVLGDCCRQHIALKIVAKPLQTDMWLLLTAYRTGHRSIQRHRQALTTYGLATIHVLSLQIDDRQTDDTSYPRLDLTVGQKLVVYWHRNYCAIPNGPHYGRRLLARPSVSVRSSVLPTCRPTVSRTSSYLENARSTQTKIGRMNVPSTEPTGVPIFSPNTNQYQWRICTQKLTKKCKFNLAHKLKRTEMFKRKMKWKILRIEIVLNVKLTKFDKWLK